MTLKQFKRVQMVVAVILGIVFSQAIILKTYIIPLIILIICTSILFYLKRRVTEVIADERDYATGGKAALLSVQIYSWLAAAVMLVLYAFRDINPTYEPVAVTLAFSSCFLMLLYAFIFRYYDHFSLMKMKRWYIIFLIFVALVMAVFTIRLFSGEDDWLCQDGKWVKHGQPDFPAPTTECK